MSISSTTIILKQLVGTTPISRAAIDGIPSDTASELQPTNMLQQRPTQELSPEKLKQLGLLAGFDINSTPK